MSVSERSKPPAPSFLTDEPADHLSAMGIMPMARKITEALPAAGEGPVTIAVYGPWGSGKTTFLRCLEHAVAEAHRGRVAGLEPVTCWFEPWRYEKGEALIVPLLTELTTRLGHRLQQRAARRAFFKLGTRLIGRAVKATARAGIGALATQVGIRPRDVERIGKEWLSYFETERSRFRRPKSESEAFKEEFEQLVRIAATGRADGSLSEPGARSVTIFIDDLDRCSHEQVKRLLESMKLFLWVPGVTFVLALDREQVRLAIAESFAAGRNGGVEPDLKTQARAQAYLEKFFLYAFDVGDDSKRFRETVLRPARSELFERLRDHLGMPAANFPWPRLRAIYEHTGPNFRRLKRALRWLYYEATLDPRRRTLPAYFAEHIFAEHYREVWIDAGDGRGVAIRTRLYEKIITILAQGLPEADPEKLLAEKIDFNTEEIQLIRTALEDPDRALDEATAPSIELAIAAAKGSTAVAALIIDIIDGHDERELKRLYYLAFRAYQMRFEVETAVVPGGSAEVGEPPVRSEESPEPAH